MSTSRAPMFRRQLEHAGRTRHFLISNDANGGWEAREEADRTVIRRVHYDDWHRVERARLVFAMRAERLQDEGWVRTDPPAKARSAGAPGR